MKKKLIIRDEIEIDVSEVDDKKCSHLCEFLLYGLGNAYCEYFMGPLLIHEDNTIRRSKCCIEREEEMNNQCNEEEMNNQCNECSFLVKDKCIITPEIGKVGEKNICVSQTDKEVCLFCGGILTSEDSEKLCLYCEDRFDREIEHYEIID